MKRFDYIRIKDVITALSLSNLCFLDAWRSVLYPSGFNGYHLAEPPTWRNTAALTLDVLLLAAFFWASYAIARRRRQERLLSIARWVFLFIAVAALNAVRRQFYGPLTAPAFIAGAGRTAFIVLLVIVFFLIVFMLARHSRRVISTAQTIVLILSPFALITLSQTAWSLVKSRPASASAKNRSSVNAGDIGGVATRVLWVIFDELDYRVAFIARPSSVALPELDRLRGESVAAANAYPPAGATLQSIPALVTGRLVSSARITGCDELTLTFDGAGAAERWGAQPNIFSRTREIGGAGAVVGWYHPYCRVIGGDLATCSSIALGREGESDRHRRGIFQSMLDYFGRTGRAIPVAREILPRHAGDNKRWELTYVEGVKQIGREGAAAAADGAISLTMIHFPAPHIPYLYDRRKKDFSFDGGGSYFDNLELVDRTFGELRRAMERSGVWDNTVVLVSSDHWWRASEEVDHRVPFILKLERQRESVIYHPSFNTVLSQDLLLALLRGELSAPSEVTTWLDRHRSIGKSPY